MEIKNYKPLYLYPIYFIKDTLQYEEDRKMLASIHPYADIKWVHLSSTKYTNLFDLVPDGSLVIMKSIFDFISIVNKKFCPYVMRYGKQKDIYDHYLKNYQNISDYYCLYYKDAAKVYEEAIYKRKILFQFDETPAFDVNVFFVIGLKIRKSSVNENDANINFNNFFDMLIHSYLVQRRNEATKYIRTSNIKRNNGIKSRKSGEYVTTKEYNSLLGIINLSKDFSGTMNDTQLMQELQISRNTLKKYKKKLKLQFEKSIISNETKLNKIEKRTQFTN